MTSKAPNKRQAYLLNRDLVQGVIKSPLITAEDQAEYISWPISNLATIQVDPDSEDEAMSLVMGR